MYNKALGHSDPRAFCIYEKKRAVSLSRFFQPLSTMSTECLPKWERKTTGGQEMEGE